MTRTPQTSTSSRRQRRLGSLATAAEQLDVSTWTVRRMIARGELAGYRVGSRAIRVDLDEVAALARPIPTAGGAA